MAVVFSWLRTTGKQLDVDATFLSFEWDYFEIIREKMLDLLYERCFFFVVEWLKSYKELLRFLEKKIKIKTKTGYYTTSILCNALENYLYI